MKLNKKALYTLAAFYDHRHCNNHRLLLREYVQKEILRDLFLSCVDEDYNYKELSKAILHCEIFFRYTNTEAAYTKTLTDKNIAKLLRNIARNGKFPKVRSLLYV